MEAVRKNRKKNLLIITILIATVLLLGLVCLFTGSSDMSFPDGLNALFGEGKSAHISIIRNIRIPRVLAAIIAGAGLAAHLPGVIAAKTVIPVIGIPLECYSNGANGLAGMDALFSIVQMPKQIPVATVGINNSANAAYLAVEILAVKYPELRKKLVEFRQKLAKDAEQNGGKGVDL